jgi:two-component system KDP operon response regulator KdpE
MARHAGQVVTHKELQCQVWGSDDPGTRSRLKLYVWYLRRKLEADPAHPRLVLSERGVGYRLATPEPEEPS